MVKLFIYFLSPGNLTIDFEKLITDKGVIYFTELCVHSVHCFYFSARNVKGDLRYV